MRMVNEGKQMRQRIADERACGTNVSVRVPPASFLSYLRLTVAAFLEEVGMPSLPAAIDAQPSSALLLCAHPEQSPYERQQLLACACFGLSCEFDSSQPFDMNDAPLNLCLRPQALDCGLQSFLSINHRSVWFGEAFKK